MKIAHIFYYYGWGGSQTMLRDIINYQVIDNEVTLIIVSKPYNEELVQSIDKRVNVIKINRKTHSKNPFDYLKLNFVVLFSGFDIIHIHEWTTKRLVWYYPCPIYLTAHSINLGIKKSESYKKIFTISKAVYEDLIGSGIENIVLAPNGIIPALIKQREGKKPDKIFKIIYVSRIYHNHKGQDLLIQAVSELKLKNYQLNLSLVGEGPSLEYLQKLVTELNLTEEVTFSGAKNRDYIYSHLCEYDLFVQTSYFEGFGLTAIEAMASKIPTLLSATGGLAEIAENGKYTYVFECGNLSDLVLKIEFIINNYLEALEKSEIAYKRVIESYKVENTASIYLNNYH